MNTVYLLTTALFFSVALKAQLSKGTKNVSAFANFQKSSNSDTDTTDYFSTSDNTMNAGASVNGGTFIKDKLLVGMSLGYNSSSSDFNRIYNFGITRQENTTKSKSSTYSIGFFARQYMPFFKDRYAFFIAAGLNGSYGIGDSESTSISMYNSNVVKSKTQTTAVSLGFRPGFAYFVTPRVAIEMLAGGSFNAGYSLKNTSMGGKRVGKNEEISSGFNFNPFGFSLGFNYFFGSASASK